MAADYFAAERRRGEALAAQELILREALASRDEGSEEAGEEEEEQE